MRQYRFGAAVTLATVAWDLSTWSCPGGTQTTMPRSCLIQCGRRRYFPAVISRNEQWPLPSGAPATVTIALASDEVEAFFAPGQKFTIWADGVADRTIWAEGLVGHGVVFNRLPPLPAPADGPSIRTAANPQGASS